MPTLQAIPQIIFYSIWSDKIWTFDGDKRVDFKRIAEAREWALAKGKAIKIRHPNVK